MEGKLIAPALTLVTSVYRSGRTLRRFNKHMMGCARAFDAAGETLQLVVVANDASLVERFWIKRLRRWASVQPGICVDVTWVNRETLYASWNRGVGLASSDCIGFWNCDDVRSPLALLEGLDRVRGGADVFYSPWLEFTPHPKTPLFSPPSFGFAPLAEFDRDEFRRSMCAGPFFLMSRKAWNHVGEFDPQFYVVGDFDWCARAAEDLVFVRGDTLGGVYYRHGRTLSGRGNSRHFAENNIVYLRSGAYDKIEMHFAEETSRYCIDLPWRKYPVPASVLETIMGASDRKHTGARGPA